VQETTKNYCTAQCFGCQAAHLGYYGAISPAGGAAGPRKTPGNRPLSDTCRTPETPRTSPGYIPTVPSPTSPRAMMPPSGVPHASPRHT